MTKDYFHGTGRSLMEHPSYPNYGLDRGLVVIAKSVPPLPLEYTGMPPAMKKHHFTAHVVHGPTRPPDILPVDAAV